VVPLNRIVERLQALSADKGVRRWLVAFSGGLDSTVLLHVIVSSMPSDSDTTVVAVHVDHAVHPDSAQWSEHCRHVADRLGVQFVLRRTTSPGHGKQASEADLRDRRYAEFAEVMQPGDGLLTAHHADDQAETLLLNLIRGSGPAGLAAIPACREFDGGYVFRPMLEISREELCRYAECHDLSWVDDPSNESTNMDRNYLRKEIVPRFVERWPGWVGNAGRSATLSREASVLIDALADADLASCDCEFTVSESACLVRLPSASLQLLDEPRQRNLLRRAIKRAGLPPMPGKRVREAVSRLIPAANDAQPAIFWPGGELRRFRETLFLQSPMDTDWAWSEHELPIDGTSTTAGPLGTLSMQDVRGEGLDPELALRGLRFSARSGGERIRLHPGGPHRRLKSLYRETAVLPWMRERIPLIYAGEKLVAVGDLWIDADFRKAPGLQVHWRGKPPLR